MTKWEPSVPLPFYYGMLWWPWTRRFGCHCGRNFWREASYRTHYLQAHATANDWVQQEGER